MIKRSSIGIRYKKFWFVNYGNPWFLRGARDVNGTGAGVFDFNNDNGHANNTRSFRVVLACLL